MLEFEGVLCKPCGNEKGKKTCGNNAKDPDTEIKAHSYQGIKTHKKAAGIKARPKKREGFPGDPGDETPHVKAGSMGSIRS